MRLLKIDMKVKSKIFYKFLNFNLQNDFFNYILYEKENLYFYYLNFKLVSFN